LLGWRTICAVELNPHCQRVLLTRQRDGLLPRFPIWDDVRTFDGNPWRGHVDVISGGFPCQDISSAGRGAGIDGSRSGLWSEFARIIGEVRPAWVLIENSPHLRTKGLVRVLKNLAELGYDARWDVLGAAHVGAPHLRRRMWIVAHANNGGERVFPVYAEMAESPQARRISTVAASVGCRQGGARGLAPSASRERQLTLPIADADREPVREQPGRSGGQDGRDSAQPGTLDWWPVAVVQGVDDGLANRMDRVRATGNGQVPRVAALAWRTLTNEI
jgi:DNA (cytosine-5)-methyltransferase 1